MKDHTESNNELPSYATTASRTPCERLMDMEDNIMSGIDIIFRGVYEKMIRFPRALPCELKGIAV